VFIVATNRLRSFDAAVTRPGRFDVLLFVGTPSLAARSKRLAGKLKTASFLKFAPTGSISPPTHRSMGNILFLYSSRQTPAAKAISKSIEQ